MLAAALAIAVVAVVVLQPEDDDDEPAPTATGQSGPRTQADNGAPKPKPPVHRVAMRNGAPVGGAKRITVKKGETVRFAFTSDAPDELHLHGYDLTRKPGPGKPARLSFKANLEGIFEIESHVAEEKGNEPLVAELVVEP